MQPGALWDYDNFSQMQKETIDAWENDLELNPTALSYSRKNKKYPPNEVFLATSATDWEISNPMSSAYAVVGKVFSGQPAEPLELYGSESGCDCWNSDDDVKLPGVDPILLSEIIMPPLPLFVDPVTGLGSTTNKNPTNYTKQQIDSLLLKYPWITKASGLIVDLEKREGLLFKELRIPAATHQLFNIIQTRSACAPCLHQNNQMFSSLMYIITQVDLENPIYE